MVPDPTTARSLGNSPVLATTLSYLSSRVIMGQRPTYEDENGFYSATSLPGSAALPFVISTGAERSLCGCLFLEMFVDGAKPRDLRFSFGLSVCVI
jgi:hypothetical protein